MHPGRRKRGPGPTCNRTPRKPTTFADAARPEGANRAGRSLVYTVKHPLAVH